MKTPALVQNRLLFTTGILLLGLVAWLALKQPEPQDAQVPPVVNGATSLEPTSAPASPELALPDAEPLAPAREEALGETAPGPLLAGRLRIEEPDGTNTNDATGKLRLILRSGDSGADFQIAVVSGQWQITRPDIASQLADDQQLAPIDLEKYSIEPVSFDQVDRKDAAAPVLRVPRFLFTDPSPLIVLTRVRGVELTVLDAETGAPLDGVRVTPSMYSTFPGPTHPSQMAPAGDLVHAAASPVRVLPPASLASAKHANFEVGAAGYAWQSIDIDFESAAPKTVRLVRGAKVTVRLVPPLEDPNVVLRLAPKDKHLPWISTPATGRKELAIDGLDPGQYDVAAQLGRSRRSTIVLANETIELHAGEQLVVTLTTRPLPKLVNAPLKGILDLPVAWKDDKPELILQLLSVSLDGSDGRYWPKQMRVDSEHFAFDFGKVQTGRYALIYAALDDSLDLELGPEGLTDVRIQIPPPVELNVHVTDASTGATAPIEQLFWRVQPGAQSRSRMFQSATLDSTSQRFFLRTPATSVELSAGGSGFTDATLVVDAREGLEVELEVRPEASALLALKSGGDLIDWRYPDWNGVSPVGDTRGKLGGLSSQEGRFWFSVTAPGTYAVAIPTLPGFKPHDPIQIDLKEGETTKLDIELVPH